MRIYSNTYELMSEMGRNLWEMGEENRPKVYQNKSIEGNDDFVTKELICEQYCLTNLGNAEPLFVFTKSRNWADAEFDERVSGMPNNPGLAWHLRKDVWEDFLIPDKICSEDGEYIEAHFDYTYAERINDLVNYKGEKSITKLSAIIKLLKDDPDTRKAILDIYGHHALWNRYDQNYLDGSKRIPCSMYYDFLIRNNARGEKQLNIAYHQRSSDFVTHFGNDVYLAWRLMEYVAREIEIKPGYLYHTIDSLHCYKKDWLKLKTSIQTELR